MIRAAFVLTLSLLAALPLQATFSIAAVDPSTGEAAVAVTTRVPFVGRAVPWVRAGVGAVATQSWTVVEYGPRGLDLLEAGVAPEEAIKRLLADDAGRERRQVGIIDMKGRSAAFTGKENGAWAGSRQGTNYTVQGNILVGPEVLDAVAAHLDSTAGTGMPIAERLILALEAGQQKGGDKRWGNLQSAAIRVADPNDPGRGGDRISLAIDVGEHEDPIGEMKRIYYRTSRRLGYRNFSEIRGNDVIELKRMLHTLGYWRNDMAEFPAAPKFTADRDLMRTDPKKFEQLVETWRREARAYDERFAVYDAEAMDAVDRFRKENGLAYEGNPRGLVDDRFVTALRERYYAAKKNNHSAAARNSRPDFLGASEPKAKIMILGVFHFSNPGLDTYKPQHTFDIMSAQRQKEVEEITDLLARFKPTKIAVEFLPTRQAKMDELYEQYVRDEHELGTNEVYQLGFRLARKLGHPRVYLVDARARRLMTQAEYEKGLEELKKSGGAEDAEDGWNERYKKLYAHDDELKMKHPLRDHLLYINSRERIRQGHGHYVVGSFKYGTGFSEENNGFFGPDSGTGWYNRNLRIFRNLQRLTESPEERILLIVGSGHLPILRFLAEASPEYELVEVDEFL